MNYRPKGNVIVLAKSAVPVSAGANTNENVLATITIPANAMGPNGSVRIWTSWTYTNGADDKTPRIRFGGASGTVYFSTTATTTATVSTVTTISNRGAANSQVGNLNAASPFQASTGALITSSVDTAADTTVVITGQKENSANTLTLESYLVELIPG